MKRIILTLALAIFTISFAFTQESCDGDMRYVDHVFELEELEYTTVDFANFSGDQLWNSGDTSYNNVCFDPRDYLTAKPDGTWDMSMTVIAPMSSVDACNERAAIIFVHGGGYAHQPGNNNSANAVAACLDMAQRGYVVALINYRKGWDIRDAKNVLGVGPLLPGCQACPCESGNADCDPYSFMKITYSMAQDARAAHRKILNEQSSFGIDEDKIFYMGSSTGAVGALHAAYGDDDMENYEDNDGVTLAEHLGGIDDIGESVNGDANFKIAGVTTVAGAIKNIEWIESEDDIPVMFNHATLDEAIKYCSGTALDMKYFINFVNSTEHLTLHGPGKLYKHISCLEDEDSKTKVWLRSHKGVYHNFCAPLGSSDPTDNCDELTSVELAQRLNAEFLKEVIVGNEISNNHKITEAAHVSGPCNIVDSNSETPCSNYQPCDLASSTEEILREAFEVFPNPCNAGDQLRVTSKYQSELLSIQLIALGGNEISRQSGAVLSIPADLPAGVYFLKLNLRSGTVAKRILVN